MKIKLILVLLPLFNLTKLNSCGPTFWEQAAEDDLGFYAQVVNRRVFAKREEIRSKVFFLLSTYIAGDRILNLDYLPCMSCSLPYMNRRPKLFQVRRYF